MARDKHLCKEGKKFGEVLEGGEVIGILLESVHLFFTLQCDYIYATQYIACGE